jgi:mannosyltransferase OCH1-like enzyme
MLQIAYYQKVFIDNTIKYLEAWCVKNNHILTSYSTIDTFISTCHKYHIVFVGDDFDSYIKQCFRYFNIRNISVSVNYTFDKNIDIDSNDINNKISYFFPHYFAMNKNLNIRIPKIIHMMWLSPNNSPIPEKYNSNIEQFKLYNPEYRFEFWTTDKAITFIKHKVPEFFMAFDSLNLIISKCDLFRMIVLYYYGGIYTDLDFYCMKNVDSLLADKDIIIVKEPREHGKKIFNGFLAATPKHPFIKGWIDEMISSLSLLKFTINPMLVFQTTGPENFYKYYHEYQNKPALTNFCDIIPYTDRDEISSECGNIDPYVYTIWSEGSQWSSWMSIDMYLAIVVIVILFVIGLTITGII